MARLKDQIKRPLLRALAAFGHLVTNSFDRPIDPRPPGRVLVMQFGGIGDVLRVFPLIEQLESAWPNSDVALLTNQAAALLELYPGVRRPRHVPFDLQWHYPRKLMALARLRREGYQLIVNPTRGDGILECATMAWLIGAPQRIGFDQRSAGFFHTHKKDFSPTQSILQQNLDLLSPLGFAAPAKLRLRIPEGARAFASDWYAQHAPHGVARVVIHPWASSHAEFRAWPFPSYVELIEQLLEGQRMTVTILGSANEAAAHREALSALEARGAHDLAGKTDLIAAAALIADSDLFVGNDSGLLHVALATGVRVVAVFGATAPAQVLPPDSRTASVVAGVPCQPCYLHQPFFAYQCAYGFRCLRHLPVASVFAEVVRIAPRCTDDGRTSGAAHVSTERCQLSAN